ncbi:acetyl-CoA carboxylase biotin carboxyl carrier protein [Catenulispora subtropica]|uniref:Biotin carboxyl carrier protein of acetyl-CoA carboxylase n=1 Tax=Catenulispora subtropica TaxID=450798 RepID=A0ABN2SRH0_9ACTN
MTVNITKKSFEGNGPKGNVHYPGAARGLVAPSPVNVAALESVCGSVAELARSSPQPPRRIRLCHGSTTVEVEWENVPAPPPAAAQATSPVVESHPGSGPPPASSGPNNGLKYICAPMVGTFYRAEEPGAAPLVAVGDLVQAGQAVGIFEVMKMLSRVEADVAGRVVEILADDGQSVEFQQRLIAVEPVSAGEGG